MLEGGLLGRKRGAGFYRYSHGQQERSPAPARSSAPAPRVWMDPSRPELAQHVRTALAPGVTLGDAPRPDTDSLIVVTPLGQDAMTEIVAGNLDPRRTVAFDALFPGENVRCLFANPGLLAEWREPARAAFTSASTIVHLVRDSVGLIAQRVVARIVNIACSIAEQRIASPSDIDRAVTLGLGYPTGPLMWGDAIAPKRSRAF